MSALGYTFNTGISNWNDCDRALINCAQSAQNSYYQWWKGAGWMGLQPEAYYRADDIMTVFKIIDACERW